MVAVKSPGKLHCPMCLCTFISRCTHRRWLTHDAIINGWKWIEKDDVPLLVCGACAVRMNAPGEAKEG